jgi:quercetin dioxygenase-like cupin family protein
MFTTRSAAQPAAIAIVAACAAVLSAQDPRPAPTLAWAPKPIAPPAYTRPQRPWVKLADLKAKHRGESSWREIVVDDGRLTAEYIAEAPGARRARRFHPDTREWFAVVEGEITVEIEGQPPITATRGSLVNIPRQTIYALETAGTLPSLRFAVQVARAKALYVDGGALPPAPRGTEWLQVSVNRTPARYDEFNQPHLNIHEAAARNEKYSGGRFVRDDKFEVLVICGHEKNLPPLDPADRGHYHAESAEFWLVAAGRIRYAIEGQAPFVAGEGDAVYVPSGTWHLARYSGPQPACRLSITEYVGNALLLEPRRPPA